MIKTNQCVDEAKSVLGGGCGTNASSKKSRENLLSSGKPEPIDINAADNGVFYLLKEEFMMQHTIIVYTRMNIIEK